ncbi:MAG: hypothetical protein ACI3XR_06115 [Eubacteriales bacterium]
MNSSEEDTQKQHRRASYPDDLGNVFLYIDITFHLFPIEFLMKLTGNSIFTCIIALYLPIIFALIILLVLSARIVQDIKYLVYSVPFQFSLYVIITLFNYKLWHYSLIYMLVAFLIQFAGAVLYNRQSKLNELSEHQSEEQFNTCKKKHIPTGVLWGLLSLVVIGYPLLGGLISILT